MKSRVFLIVLDSFGVGELPDSADFGDEGSHTLCSVAESEDFDCPNLLSLGLFNIDGCAVAGKKGVDFPRAAYGKMPEKSSGKDTTTGHWEIAGIVSPQPLPTYPNGFPAVLIAEFEKRTGRKTICNLPYSGTDVIRDYGDEHCKTGALIVYTSADSVFQIAAHEALVPPEQLYEYCRIARRILTGKHGVGRVIARPFVGMSGAYTRTANRRDFSIEPPAATLLDQLNAAGLDTISVGKISDIFCGRGVSEAIVTHGNDEGIAATAKLLFRDFNGLCFVNLVDFDMLYGHRRDIAGYAKARSDFDVFLSMTYCILLSFLLARFEDTYLFQGYSCSQRIDLSNECLGRTNNIRSVS